MKLETEVSTDIAMVGLWDSDPPCTEVSFKKWNKLIEQDSRDSKLLYVETGADGGDTACLTDSKEDMERFDLSHYKLVEGDFSVTTVKGNITVGGIEDYATTLV